MLIGACDPMLCPAHTAAGLLRKVSRFPTRFVPDTDFTDDRVLTDFVPPSMLEVRQLRHRIGGVSRAISSSALPPHVRCGTCLPCACRMLIGACNPMQSDVVPGSPVQGKHSTDEICCETGLSARQLVDLLDADPYCDYFYR